MARQLESQLKEVQLSRWFALLILFGNESGLATTVVKPNSEAHRLQAASRFALATLKKYIDEWNRWALWADSSGCPQCCFEVGQLADFILSVCEGAICDRGRRRTQAARQFVKSLTCVAANAQLFKLSECLVHPRIIGYSSVNGVAADRRDAGPFPLVVVASWEILLAKPGTSLPDRLFLGLLLLVTWGGLRFGDAQRVEVASRNIEGATIGGFVGALR